MCHKARLIMIMRKQPLFVILARSFKRFSEERGSEVAASLAYYTLFSLFPFFLALIAAGGYILEREQLFRQVQELFASLFPGSREIIVNNLNVVLELRGAVGILGLIGLLWSASGMFSSLIYNVNRAWPDTQLRNYFRKRLAGIGIAFLLGGLVVLSIIATTALSVLTRIDLQLVGNQFIQQLPYPAAITRLFSWMLKALVLTALYLWAPNKRVPIRFGLVGGAVAASGWELATAGFTWYLTSGIPRYELIYGSLGAIVILMFWIYLSSIVILYGAHLTAAVEYILLTEPSKPVDPIEL
jgi:membrane protein